ncbi:MAG TPA: hypothetical protein VJB70_05400 [Candidatus Paceibacterota bacterium]
MIPQTSLTLQGFLQGLHGNMTGLIGSIIAIAIVLFIVRWFINKMAKDADLDDSETATARSWANGIAGVVALVVIAGFCINAVTYATNAIPRSELDRSSINRDMDVNINR